MVKEKIAKLNKVKKALSSDLKELANICDDSQSRKVIFYIKGLNELISEIADDVIERNINETNNI